ncbi:MAG: FG-GAP-like repeat-containing protein [Bacteroidia bacterium]
MKKTALFLAFISLLQLNAQVCFSPISNFNAPNRPYSIINNDFNSDGNPDLVVCNYSSNKISILLGNGIGGFGAAVSYTTDTNPISLISADFNNDGNIDLATANRGSDNVSVFLGNGNGGFGLATIFLVGSTPYAITSNDFNGDGNIDLAIANRSSNDVSILLGTGTGSFGIANSFSVGLGPISVINTDFNADGILDLATANNYSSNVSILFGTGSGTFGTAINYPVGTNPSSVISADFNGDGKTDLVTANYTSNNISILLGVGAGAFGAATNFSVNINPNNVISTDLNADGKADLVTANYTSNDISLLLGTGTGSFVTTTNYAVATNISSVTSGDFNNDGKLDLASANYGVNNISVLLNITPNITINGNDTICLGSSVALTANGAINYLWNLGATTSSIIVTPTNTTQYNVSDANSCGYAKILVTVLLPPTPTICMVTTDSLSNYNYNNIYWDNSQYTNADSFIVYRYDGILNTYLRIGAVSKDSSRLTDTARGISGPHGGDPNYTSYKYKLAIKDTCGNIGSQSPLHQTVFIQDQQNGNFNISQYIISAGQTNSVTGYDLYKDATGTGNSFAYLTTITGTSATDPFYSSTANYRVDILGFNCISNQRLANQGSSTLTTRVKSHSNTARQAGTNDIKDVRSKAQQLIIYPCPANNTVNIICTGITAKTYINLYDATGRLILQQKATASENQILDVQKIDSGLYLIEVNGIKKCLAITK